MLDRRGLVSVLLALGCGPTVGSDDSGAGSSTGERPTTSSTTDTPDSTATGSSDTGPPPIDESVVEAFMAEACDVLLACDCYEPLFEDVTACLDALGPELWAQLVEAMASGLRWNAECAAARLGWLSESCADRLPRPCEPLHCPLFVGDRQLGGACDELGEHLTHMSNCAAGLGCYEGTCIAICGDTPDLSMCSGPFGTHCPAGTACTGDIGSACTPTSGEGEECYGFGPHCDPGLECFFDDICVVPGELGEPCAGYPPYSSHRSCVDGTYCNLVTGVCVLPREDGRPCDGNEHCLSDQCLGGTCVPHLEEGEPCEPAGPDCGQGLRCDSDLGVCVALQATSCSDYD